MDYRFGEARRTLAFGKKRIASGTLSGTRC
jgi:hypothetical protein